MLELFTKIGKNILNNNVGFLIFHPAVEHLFTEIMQRSL